MTVENVEDKVDRSKKDKFVASYYDKDELQKLFEASKGDPLELMIYITAFYGLRRSEAVGLKWSAIDFRNNPAQGDQNKDRRQNHVNPERQVKDCLQPPYLAAETGGGGALAGGKRAAEKEKRLCKSAWKKEADYLFVNEMGVLIRPNYVTQHFKILLKNSGLREIRFHDLRHSCTTLMLTNNVDMKSIQAWMGYSNFSTTADLYPHTDYTAKLQSAGAISAALSVE